MAKYLNLLIVALFACIGVALVSCGNDDDDLNGGNSSITINGQGYITHENCCAADITDYNSSTLIDIELHPSNSDKYALFPVAKMEFVTKTEQLSEGMVFTIKEVYVALRNSSSDIDSANDYKSLVSGSISVAKVNGANVVLQFNDLTLANKNGKTIVIKGTMTVEHRTI
ncbi:MAG: hypothetical protein K2K25_02255 [Muribaculaceae bacterium]|nr:hypothetical protein [Muribaculaceae bacterium]